MFQGTFYTGSESYKKDQSSLIFHQIMSKLIDSKLEGENF